MAIGEFAFELRDQLAHRLAGDLLEARGVLDRLRPVAFGLVDADQVLERLRRTHVQAHQVAEDRLGAIEQARAHVVLAQREQRLHLLLVGKIGALHQRLVQADRAIDFTAATEQMAQRDLRLERVLVELGDAQEDFDRLVGLLVEQVVQAAEVRGRQAADLRVAMAFATATTDAPNRSAPRAAAGGRTRTTGDEGQHASAHLRSTGSSARASDRFRAAQALSQRQHDARRERQAACDDADQQRTRGRSRRATALARVKPRSSTAGCGLSAPDDRRPRGRRRRS
jgi:uncharacterized protein YhaN